MASTGNTLLRELWQGGGSVTTLQRGPPRHFPHWPQPRAQALQVPFNHPQCTPSSARLYCSGVPPSPLGRAAGWGRGGRACWCPQGPDHSPISRHKHPPLPFVPPPGTDVQIFFLQQWQQHFCFYLCQEGSKVLTNTTSLSNQFLCLHTISIKMFLLVLGLNFSCFYPYSP